MIDSGPSTPVTRTLSIVAAVNDDQVLERDLGSSPMIQDDGVQLIVERGHSSAAGALNAGLDRAAGDIVIFAHQDVYLPRGWERRLLNAIRELDAEGRRWAVLGVTGIGDSGPRVGAVYSSGLRAECCRRVEGLHPVVSIDEVVIVLRRETGLRFDETIPGFHMYGTDLVQTAIVQGYECFVFDGPVVHNSQPSLKAHRTFAKSYRAMQRKWRARLPIQTPIIPVTVSGYRLLKRNIRMLATFLLRIDAPGSAHPDPARIAREYGYEERAAGAVSSAVPRRAA